VTNGFFVSSESKNARRIFIFDGVGNTHPLRERWRIRLENVLYRRVLFWIRDRSVK
jgi:hypothetical protein